MDENIHLQLPICSLHAVTLLVFYHGHPLSGFWKTGQPSFIFTSQAPRDSPFPLVEDAPSLGQVLTPAGDPKPSRPHQAWLGNRGAPQKRREERRTHPPHPPPPRNHPNPRAPDESLSLEQLKAESTTGRSKTPVGLLRKCGRAKHREVRWGRVD